MRRYGFVLMACRFVALAMVATEVSAQCGPGIPGGGNPSCVPPDVFYGSLPNGRAVQPVFIWEERFGAVAIDRGKDVFGAGAGYKSSKKALKKAIKRCVSNGGTEDGCTAGANWYSNGCGVVADSVIGLFYLTGADLTRTRLDVLWDCEQQSGQACRLVSGECSLPVSVRVR